MKFKTVQIHIYSPSCQLKTLYSVESHTFCF